MLEGVLLKNSTYEFGHKLRINVNWALADVSDTQNCGDHLHYLPITRRIFDISTSV